MRKIVIALIISFLSVLNGFIVCLFIFQVCNVSNTESSHVILESCYYIMSSIGVFTMLMTVITALFGNELRNLMFKEKCEVELEENKFQEIIKDEEVTSIEAIRYDCNIVIKNVGSTKLEGCSLYLEKIICKQSDTTPKDLEIKLPNRRQIYTEYQSKEKIILLPNEKRVVNVLRILPEANDSTPDSGDISVIPTHLHILGYNNNKKKKMQKGKWEVRYCLTSSKSELFRFLLIISWTGIWKSRETEMNNEISVELKRL